MKRTGILSVNNGVSQLQGIRLARASANDAFSAATNFLANRGLDDGDFIFATGTDGAVGDVPAMFIAEAGLAIAGPGGMELAAVRTATAGKKGGSKKGGSKKGGGKKGGSKKGGGKKGRKGTGGSK
ncbi:MAG: hypothetical protein JOZ96_00280 [Acidobacteria bacterium]|nr:hypothetical protein [Acidobacteriota bacterium]